MARLDAVASVVSDAWNPLVSEDITEEEETVLDCRASPVGSPHARTCPTSELPSPPCFEDGHTVKCDGGSKIKEDGDWGGEICVAGRKVPLCKLKQSSLPASACGHANLRRALELREPQNL